MSKPTTPAERGEKYEKMTGGCRGVGVAFAWAALLLGLAGLWLDTITTEMVIGAVLVSMLGNIAAGGFAVARELASAQIRG